MSGNIHQSDKDKLKATVDVATDQSIEVTQDDAAKLKGTVTQAAKDRTVTNDTAANLKTQIWQDDASRCVITVYQEYANQLNATVTQAAKDRTVTNATAANLKAEVTQLAKDRTVTGSVTVTPSGDMARKAYYDRNITAITEYDSAGYAAHAWTTRYTYTVPADHIFMSSLASLDVVTPIATATKVAQTLNLYADALMLWVYHTSTTSNRSTLLEPLPLYLTAGQVIQVRTKHDDTVNHTFSYSVFGVEFDV